MEASQLAGGKRLDSYSESQGEYEMGCAQGRLLCLVLLMDFRLPRHMLRGRKLVILLFLPSGPSSTSLASGSTNPAPPWP